MPEFEQLRQYLKDKGVENTIMGALEGVLREMPSDPRAFILAKLGSSVNVASQKKKAEFVPAQNLINLFESTKSITAEISPKETINIIIQETIRLLHCDRVSLFVFDPKLDMLLLSASNLQKPIRVAVGQGIAGHVFQKQEVVNIPDCYADPRFDASFDKKTGYYTKSILTMPIMDYEGSSVGVLQAINKMGGGEFSADDQLLLGHLTQHAGIALRNAEVYKDAVIASERANGLLHMTQSLSQNLGIQSLLVTITMHASELVNCDKCTVLLVDHGQDQLWSIASDTGKEIQVPLSRGISGECARTGKVINIPDAYQDPRFSPEQDRKSGYRTQSILALPVVHNASVLAVVQMINKKEFDGAFGTFTEEDEQIMDTFTSFVANQLASSSFVRRSGTGSLTEAAKAYSPMQKHATPMMPGVASIVEGDENAGKLRSASELLRNRMFRGK